MDSLEQISRNFLSVLVKVQIFFNTLVLRENGGNNSQHCWELLRPCWQCCTNKRNDSQQCWDLQCVVGRIQLIRLCKLEFGSNIVACMAPTMLEELCKRLQHCCPKLHRSRNKRNARSCWPTLLRPLARGLTPEITGSSPIACFRQSVVHC